MTTIPRRPRGGMTAAEHELWLKETGQHEVMLARQRQQDEERAAQEAEYRRAEVPLVAELRAAGFDIQSAWDLVNSPGSYPAAIPILLAHLPRPYPAAVREGIARALAVRDTKALGWQILTQSYVEEREIRVKDGLAAAVAAVADSEVLDDVVALARDTENGPSRVLLLSALGRSKESRAREALLGLESDPELTAEVQVILRRLARRKR